MSRTRSGPAQAIQRLLTGMGVSGVVRKPAATKVYLPGWIVWAGRLRALGPNGTITQALALLEEEGAATGTKAAVALQKGNEIEQAHVTIRAEDFAALLVAAQEVQRTRRV